MAVLNRRGFFRSCLASGAVAASPGISRGQPPPAEQAADGAVLASMAPRQRLQAMLDGAAVTQLVYVAARARLADRVGTDTPTVDELAGTTGLHADSLYRVMRALASHGVFEEQEGRRFRHSAISRLLRSEGPESMRAAAEVRGEDFFWRSWGALRESVRTGQTGHELVFGENTFDWFAKHQDAARLFDEFQASMTTASANAIAQAYPFPAGATIADIGGGNGTLIAAILDAHPSARGVLFDLPHVVDAARPRLAAHASRLAFTGGNFFEAVPPGAHVYVMKYIIHDWEEPKAIAILGNTRKAMPPGATLLVIEDLVCAPNVPCRAKLGDVNMLVRTGGRNRTRDEYEQLLDRGGFRLVRSIQAMGDLHILETVPA